MNALVTGTSKGLGLEVAKHLLSTNWHVFGLARSGTAINHDNYKHFAVDISNVFSLCNLFSIIKNVQFSLLINNAAYFKMATLTDTTELEIDSIIDTNLKGSIYVTRHCINLMPENSRIIFINSVAGLEELENQSIYCASKYGLTAFAGVMGKELRPQKINVTSIHPGGINTTLWNESNPYPCGNPAEALSVSEVVRVIQFIIDSPPDVDYKTVKLFPVVEWHN